jgi:1-acyl-sn-glycerol-3-phosphate acyltransferase
MIEPMLNRHGPRRLGATYRFAVATLKPPMTVLTRRDWRGREWLSRYYPPTDGIVVVSNHLSWFDALPLAHVLWNSGRPPRFLAKQAVFDVPVMGRLITNTGQIPVLRETRNAADAVRAAVDAVDAGESVVIYPEGTITRDPSMWPMTGKTGAARIALLSGAPVIPIAQWGPQEVMGPYVKEFKVLPRKVMHMRVGPPVALDDLRGEEPSAEVLAEATDRIMDAITQELEKIRGVPAPAQRLDFKAWREAHGQPPQEEQ